MLCTWYGNGLTKGIIIQIFYHGLDVPTQEILDTRGIFLYNTPNEAFKILEDNVLKLDFSDNSQSPKPKTIVFAGRSNINSNHAILTEKFKALATKIDSKFLIIRKQLKEMQTEVNERTKNQVVELERPIKQRNRQAIIENLERQFEYLNKKVQRSESLPRTTYTKLRHESDSTMNIPYTNVKTFANDVLLNHVGGEELNSINGIGTGSVETRRGGMSNYLQVKEVSRRLDMCGDVQISLVMFLNPVNELCGYVLWKPSRDFTHPLGPPSGLKGLLHTLNATVIPTKEDGDVAYDGRSARRSRLGAWLRACCLFIVPSKYRGVFRSNSTFVLEFSFP
ncbi:hypothetical protein Tco_0788391 [Tanacetum coccineum]